LSAAPLIAAAAFCVLSGGIWLFVLAGERRRKLLRERLAGVAGAAIGESAKQSAPPPRPILVRRRTPRVSGGLQARLDLALDGAGRRINLWHLAGAAAIAMAVAIVFTDRLLQLNPLVGILASAGAASAAPLFLLRLMQRRYQRQFLDIFPDALDLVARAVRAGLPALDALDVAARELPAPVGTELKRTLDEMRIGVDNDEALEHLAERVPVPDLRFFVVTLTLQRRTGGALAETLGNLSGVIRQRKALRRKARALTAEAKTSAWAVGLSPFLAGGAVYYHSPPLMMILFNDPRGRFMLGLAILFLVLGFVTMAYMIRRALR
jgi:tight adherence protein B